MMERLLTLLKLTGFLAVAATASQPSAHALTLAEALARNKVCEKINGFIQPTPGNENEAQTASLVEYVNTERRNLYAEIAAKDGIACEAVAKEMAAQQLQSDPGKFCR